MPKILSYSCGQSCCYQAPCPGLHGKWGSLMFAWMGLGSSSTSLCWAAANYTALSLPVAQLLVCLWNNYHSLLDWEASLGAGDLIRIWKMPLASRKKILQSVSNLPVKLNSSHRGPEAVLFFCAIEIKVNSCLESPFLSLNFHLSDWLVLWKHLPAAITLDLILLVAH